MGNSGKGVSRQLAGVSRALDLHKQLNPVRGLEVLVAVDLSSGQLFFCSATGSVLGRDEYARRRGAELELERKLPEPVSDPKRRLAEIEAYNDPLGGFDWTTLDDPRDGNVDGRVDVHLT